MDTTTVNQKTLFTLVSYTLLSLAVQLRTGTFGWDALICVVIALFFFVASFLPSPTTIGGQWFNRMCLMCIVILGASGGVVAPGGNILLRVFYVLLAQGAVIILVTSFQNSEWTKTQRIVPLFSPIILAVALLVPILIPDPKIDVWIVTQDAAKALLNLQNPYALPHPDLQDHTYYFPHGYNYPPLFLPVYSLFYATLGDVRFASVAALFVMWLAIRKILPKPAPVTSQILVLLYFINPLHIRVIEKSWTEGVIQALFAITIVTIARSPLSFWAYLWAALTVSSKQYLLFVGIFLTRTLTSFKKWAWAAIVAAIPIGLFLIPNPIAFYNEVVGFFIHYPPRDDSLSLYSVFMRYGHFQLPVLLTLLPLLVVMVLYLLRQRLSLAESLRWMTLGYFLLLLFGCSFANYYYLLESMLWWTLFLDHISTRRTNMPAQDLKIDPKTASDT